MTSARERDPFDTPPAPVVTEHGTFGALPPPRVEERARRSRRSRTRLLATWLTFVAAAWLLALAAAQATSRAVAVPALERTIDALTDVDALLLLHEPEIRAAGQQAQPGATVTVPGFPVASATLTAEAARAGSREQWRATLLATAANAVYEHGITAFAQGERATDSGLLSTPGGVRRVIEGISASHHDLANTAMWTLGFAVLVLTTIVLASGDGARRFVAIGLALVVAALLATFGGLVATFLVMVAGHDQSQLATEVSGIARTLAWMPVREAATRVGLAGLAIAVPAAIVVLWFERAPVDGPRPRG